MGRGRNPNLKKPGEQVEYTYKQVQELRRCATDPKYFIQKYVKIQHPTRGAVKFKLYSYQEQMIDAFQNQKDVIVLSARQTGKCFFRNGQIIIAQKPTGVKKIIFWVINKLFYPKSTNRIS